jgi:hypothetical protein
MTYEIVPETRYVVMKDGARMDPYGGYLSPEQAQQRIRELEARDAAVEAKKLRDKIARSRPGKWTPQSLRKYLAKDPHWEIQDMSEGGRDKSFVGAYKMVWRELDSRQPFITRELKDGTTYDEPNFEIYGSMWIARCNDDGYSTSLQFSLRNTRDESINAEHEYATVDRLAAALIRAGIMEPVSATKAG